MGEIWDIYDVNKQLTGRTMKRNDWNMKDGDYHLTVLGIIKRHDNTFLITGVDVSHADGGFEFSYRRDNPEEKDNYFVDIYKFNMDITEADIHLQTEETAGFRFATAEEIKAIADRGEFLHYDSIRKVFE